MLAITHATVTPAMSADPVFAAIEAHREALHVYEAEVYYQAKRRKGRWVAREEVRAAAEVYEAATSTPESAAALAAYHTARGERAGSPGARRAARRRLRKVLARPGAVLPPRPT